MQYSAKYGLVGCAVRNSMLPGLSFLLCYLSEQRQFAKAEHLMPGIAMRRSVHIGYYCILGYDAIAGSL